jgi:7-cyano-7-deazaguanine synthase
MVVRPASRPGCVILLSGGMDSATCLALADANGGPVHALTVVYGQRHDREIRSARALARRYDIQRHVIVRIPLGPLLDSSLTDRRRSIPSRGPRPGRIPSTYVPARNTILLAVALGYAESHRLGAIVLGANAVDYSGYPDCRPAFLNAFERLTRVATKDGVETGRGVRILAPLLKMSKAEIVRLGERLGVPWGLTWSCYQGGQAPCGRCDSCRLRQRGFRGAGVPDTLRSARIRSKASRSRAS